MSGHRKPIIPYNDIDRGYCRWCGEEILRDGKRNKRARWHEACVAIYRRQAYSDDLRFIVYKRDQGRCAHCGCSSSGWQADHIQPLIEGGSFSLENVQTLCRDCHKRKSAREATERADRRKSERPNPRTTGES